MKRRITMEVTIEEHENGSVTVWMRKPPAEGHDLMSVKRRESISRASMEIGAVALELAEEVND